MLTPKRVLVSISVPAIVLAETFPVIPMRKNSREESVQKPCAACMPCEGMMDRSGICINRLKNREYCGATEGCVGKTASGDGYICVNGTCALNCPTNLTICSGIC